MGTSLKYNLTTFLEKVSFGRIRLPNTNWVETLWILDLRKNSARKLGEITQAYGFNRTWKPSPNFNRGYLVPINREEGSSFILCDLEKETFMKIKFKGDLQGWWDARNIMIKDPAKNFVLLDVDTGKTNLLFSAGTISAFLSQSGIASDPADVKAFANWNGLAYDFYFSTNRDFDVSFLLKATRSDPPLKLLNRNFKFEHVGRLDDDATHYLYCGENISPNGAVLLRDVASNTVRAIVPPDNSGRYSNPRYYRDEIIYFRNRRLWRINLNGSNNVPLFPPSGN
jgi:hypothetical protein